MTGISAPPHEGELAEFAAQQGGGLLRFAYLLTGARAPAEDLVQTVLLQLTRRGITDLADPGTYARRCIMNLHRSLGRRAAAQLRALRRVPDPMPSTADVELRDAVRRALVELTPRQRAAVVLRYYEDRADDEIAEILGCAQATVRSLVARALPKLRPHLEED